MSRRAHGDSGVSEERPRRATALPRSSDRRLTAQSRSAHGVLVACKELSLRIDGVRTAHPARPMRFYGVFTECIRAYEKTSAPGILQKSSCIKTGVEWCDILPNFRWCWYRQFLCFIYLFYVINSNAGEDGHITTMILAISEIIQ